jgi:superkiller protein 3
MKKSVHMIMRTILVFSLLLGIAAPALSQSQYSLAQANAYVARSDWNGLLAYTQSWTRADPNARMAWYYMGEVYGTKFNRPADAAAAFQRALQLQPKWPEAWWALAYTDVQLERYADANQAAKNAVEQAPQRFNYWNGLAMTFAALNRWDDVQQTLEEEQQRMQSAHTTEYDWYNLGNGLSSSAGYKDAAKHYAEAKAAYVRALQMNPNLAEAWNNLGVLEQRLGNSQAALAAYQRAAALGNSNGASNYKVLNQALTAPPPQAGGARGGGGLAALNASRRMLQDQWAWQHGGNRNFGVNPYSP